MTSNTTDKPVSDPNQRTMGWETAGLLLVLILACSIAFSLPNADPDLWGHVQYGRDLLIHGLPSTTTYSYTARDHVWINHENLSELLLALGANTIGPSGLLIVKCQLGTLIIGLMAIMAWRQGIGLPAICVVAALVSASLASFWQLRPQVLSFVLFALLLVILRWAFREWEGRWRLPWGRQMSRQDDANGAWDFDPRQLRRLWPIPVLFVVWANTHGGFVAGLCVCLLYLGCRGIEALVTSGATRGRIVAGLFFVGGVAVAATLLNPYGIRLHWWLLSALRVPRPEITEWHALSMQSEVFWPFVGLVAMTVIALAASRRSLDATQLVVLSAVAMQAVLHERHIPFFAITVGFWIPVHVQSFLERIGISHVDDEADEEPTAAMGTLLATGLGMLTFILAGLLASRLGQVTVKRDKFPVSAVQYMADHDVSGRLVVTYNWAQYIIAAFGQRDAGDSGIAVAFDGRFRTCYPQQLVDQHFDFVLGMETVPRHRNPDSPPPDGSRILHYGQPDLVLISRLQEHSVHVMNQNSADWSLLYQDALAQLWGRRDKYDEPTSEYYIPPASRDISDRVQSGCVSWPALPRQSSRQNLVDRRVDPPSDIGIGPTAYRDHGSPDRVETEWEPFSTLAVRP